MVNRLHWENMANGRSSFRPIFILIACFSALYFAVGPLTSMYYTRTNRQEQITEDDEIEEIAELREKMIYLENVVHRLENSMDELSKVKTREDQTLKESPKSPQTNVLFTQPSSSSSSSSLSSSTPAVINKYVGDHDNEAVNDGLTYDCPEEEKEHGKLVQNNMSVFGKPVYAKNKTVMYVAMPKCGSRTLVWATYRLQRIHRFGKPTSLDYMLDDRPLLKMKNYFAGRLVEAEEGAMLHGHYRFIDMSDFPNEPIFISMIRDPIDRFVSKFYFMRHGDMDMSREELIQKSARRRNGALLNETIDDCVEKNRSECTSSLLRNIYTTSFCGYNIHCSKFPHYALQRAKRNVDKFLVIGLVEEYDLSMAVFDKLLPETFGGVAKIYAESKDRSLARSKTSYKEAPSPKTYSILRERMKSDYEFYDYVKKRLHKVAKELGIGTCSS